MIKQIAWDAFKKTGDIETFLELKQFENTENNIKDMTITPMGMSEKTNQINENGKDINQKPNIFINKLEYGINKNKVILTEMVKGE